MKSYLSGLLWLLALVALPLSLLATLTIGAGSSTSLDLLRLSSGLFAYVWLLAALFLSSKPHWLDKKSCHQAQFALFVASLPLGFGHAGTGAALALSSLSGHFALLGLLAGSIYSLLFWLGHRVKLWQASPVLMAWFQGLNALVCGLIFIHVLWIDSLRQNLFFSLPICALTAIAFLAFFRKGKQSASAPRSLGEQVMD